MLRLRVITGLVLGPVVVAAIVFSEPWQLALFFLLFVSLGLYEWAGLTRIPTLLLRLVYAVSGALMALLLWRSPDIWYGVVIAVSAVWVLALISVVSYPRFSTLLATPIVIGTLGWVVCVGGWLAVNFIREKPDGRWMVLWLIVVIAAADTGAYFAGRRFGNTQLLPNVSPGKTWEGVWGGLVLGVLIGQVVVTISGLLGLFGSFGWLFLTVFVVAVSIVGDLFESVVKRISGAKDSGGILPGHGGVLDRIDSLLAAAPVYALMTMLS
ncbi:MAG: phosphatidate cytidylyltransferase [Pseudomonadales bacterium]